MPFHVSKFALLIGTYLVAACSGGGLTGAGAAERKEPKKKEANAAPAPGATSGNSGDDEASQPQVVTGGYLACTPDQNNATGAETGFGCVLLDENTDKKIDLGTKKLVYKASSSSGPIVGLRQEDDPATSNFHNHVYVPKGTASDLTIEASIGGSSSVATYQTKVVKMDVSRAMQLLWKPLIPEYTPQQVAAWCALALAKPFKKNDPDSNAEWGAACGGDYIKKNGCAISSFSNVCSLFQSRPGSCEGSEIPNRALNVERCK